MTIVSFTIYSVRWKGFSPWCKLNARAGHLKIKCPGKKVTGRTQPWQLLALTKYSHYANVTVFL